MKYKFDNNELNYQIYGGGDKTLLLIHDIGGYSQDFKRLIDRLITKSKVVTIDLCGHGESYLPRQRVSIKTMAREIVNFIRDCYIGKVDVVAVGVGGAIALEAFNLSQELFCNFVFLDTFISKSAWQLFSENIRPVHNAVKYNSFRDVFIKWISAFRDDFFIFCDEFDGRDLLRLVSNRMLFIYGDRGKNNLISRTSMDLPEFSNIVLKALTGADRWMLENKFQEVETIIIKFLFDNDHGWEADNDENKNTNGPEPDVNNLMYIR